MSYLENRKKIEIRESYIEDIEGTLEEVIDDLTSQHDRFKEEVKSVHGYECFIVIEKRYTYYSDTEVPHFVAYRWETVSE